MRYISTTDTAKMIRRELKATFPSVTFHVTSKSYAGGSSIRVGWTDGPTVASVRPVVGKYEGATFDPMQDLKEYRDSNLNGEPVHFGADYIFTDRALSPSMLRAIGARVAAKWGIEPPVIDEGGNITNNYILPNHARRHRNDDIRDLLYREASEVSA